MKRSHLEARLVRDPFRGEAYLSEARTLALRVPADYEPNKIPMVEPEPPVFVTQRQHYRLLDELLSAADALLPTLEYLLVETPRSYLNALPDSVLEPRVLMTASGGGTAELLLAKGVRSLLRLEFTPRRGPAERHDNRLALTLYSDRCDPAVLPRLLDRTSLAKAWERIGSDTRPC